MHPPLAPAAHPSLPAQPERSANADRIRKALWAMMAAVGLAVAGATMDRALRPESPQAAYRRLAVTMEELRETRDHLARELARIRREGHADEAFRFWYYTTAHGYNEAAIAYRADLEKTGFHQADHAPAGERPLPYDVFPGTDVLPTELVQKGDGRHQ